jgi:hypothetical protein
MIFVKLRSVSLPATLTSKISNFSNGLVDVLILKYERGGISTFEFVSRVSCRYKNE